MLASTQGILQGIGTADCDRIADSARFPAMVALLFVGVAIALIEEPSLAGDLAAIHLSPHLPTFAWPTLSWLDPWVGGLFLTLPQLTLTFGNALISVSEENNRLFPDRPVTERRVALSTGLMNLWSSTLGGIPMCHGAGGIAGHVRFGARTGGASIMLGVLIGLFACHAAKRGWLKFSRP